MSSNTSGPRILTLTLAVASTALALTILILSAQCLAWYSNHASSLVDWHYTVWNATAPERGVDVRRAMKYKPYSFSLSDLEALLAVGVVSAVMSFGIMISRVWPRKDTSPGEDGAVSTASRKANQTRTLLTLLILTISLLAATTAVAITWQAYVSAMKYILWWSIPASPQQIYGCDNELNYPDYTFETWNYALEVVIAPDPFAGSPTRGEVTRLSNRAKNARILTVPLAVVALAQLAIELGAMCVARSCERSDAAAAAAAAKLGRVEYVGDGGMELQDRGSVERGSPPDYARREPGLPTYAEIDARTD